MPNGADPFPIFVPALATIIAISRDSEPRVKTQLPHTFLEGESVRILVPAEYGMRQINNKVVNISIVNDQFPDLFFIDIDSTAFDAFIVPVNPTQSAQAIPVGENALMLTGATRNVLPYP